MSEIPWVNYDYSPVLEAREKKKQRNQNLLITAGEVAAGQYQAAAANLMKQKEINQRGYESAAKLGLEQQHLDFQKSQHSEQQMLEQAYGISKINNMMTPSHPDYNPEQAKALAKALGIHIPDQGGGMDSDALLPMGGP